VRSFLAVVLFMMPVALAAQSVMTISTQQCVWHAGDDPSWSAPANNDAAEAGWQPYSTRTLKHSPERYWLRCPVDTSALRGTARPSLQVTLFAAYEAFVDGERVGEMANLQSGNYSINAVRSYPLPGQVSTPGPHLLALRISSRGSLPATGPVVRLVMVPLQLRWGDAGMLDALRAQNVLAREADYLKTTAGFAIIGVLSVVLIGLYINDRSRREFLLLSLVCLSLGIVRGNELCAARLANYSYVGMLFSLLVGNLILTASQIPFFFAVARRRIPVVFLIMIAIILLAYFPYEADLLLGMHSPAWVGPLNLHLIRPLNLAAHTAISVAPFVAFWPYAQIPRRLRPVAVLCMMWGIADFVWFGVEITAFDIPGIPNLFTRWGLPMLEIRGFFTACVLATLLWLLFRDQRRITEERALLSGEMQAAREIQRMLAPEQIPTAPGLRVDVAFRPMRDVGGDFYLCRVLPDGRQRVLLGDVSGKGSAAAMTAALLLGGAEDHESLSPSDLLAHLNRVLVASRVGGFATCLCLDLAPGGTMTIANAGHLPPYRDGRELECAGGLPLGLVARTDYPEWNFELSGETLTLLSDGVVEARSAAGELFGFDRTCDLSSQPAEKIAETAQAFGQEDDITVLTLTLEPVADRAAATML
jgi:hypothetical protein